MIQNTSGRPLLTPPLRADYAKLYSQIEFSTLKKDNHLIGIIKYDKRTFSVKMTSQDKTPLEPNDSEAMVQMAKLVAGILLRQGAFTLATPFKKARIIKEQTTFFDGNDGDKLIATSIHGESEYKTEIEQDFEELTKSIKTIAQRTLSTSRIHPKPKPPALHHTPASASSSPSSSSRISTSEDMPSISIEAIDEGDEEDEVTVSSSPVSTSTYISPSDIGPFEQILDKEIQKTFDEELKSIKIKHEQLRSTTLHSSWEDILAYQTAMETLNKQIFELKDVVAKNEPTRQAVTNKIRETCVEYGIPKKVIDNYLDLSDPKKFQKLLITHTELYAENSPYNQLAKQLQDSTASNIQNIVSKVDKEYQAVEAGGGGDCFFHSVNKQIPKEQGHKEWRELITKALIKNDKNRYGTLVAERMRIDRMDLKNDYAKYCEYIAKDGSWGSNPELHAVSYITKRPVLVVQKEGKNPIMYGDLINPDLPGEPLIFFNDATVKIVYEDLDKYALRPIIDEKFEASLSHEDIIYIKRVRRRRDLDKYALGGIIDKKFKTTLSYGDSIYVEWVRSGKPVEPLINKATVKRVHQIVDASGRHFQPMLKKQLNP